MVFGFFGSGPNTFYGLPEHHKLTYAIGDYIDEIAPTEIADIDDKVKKTKDIIRGVLKNKNVNMDYIKKHLNEFEREYIIYGKSQRLLEKNPKTGLNENFYGYKLYDETTRKQFDQNMINLITNFTTIEDKDYTKIFDILKFIIRKILEYNVPKIDQRINDQNRYKNARIAHVSNVKKYQTEYNKKEGPLRDQLIKDLNTSKELTQTLLSTISNLKPGVKGGMRTRKFRSKSNNKRTRRH